MAVVEELRGVGYERLSRNATAKANLDNHIEETNFRHKCEKLIIPPSTLRKIKEKKMAKLTDITDGHLLVLLKHCRFNSKYFKDVLNIDTQVYPIIGVMAYLRNLSKGNIVKPKSISATLAERVRDFYNLYKGQIRTPKAEEAMGYVPPGGRNQKQLKNKAEKVATTSRPLIARFSKLVVLDTERGNAMVFDVKDKSKDYIQGIKDALSKVLMQPQFIVGDEEK